MQSLATTRSREPVLATYLREIDQTHLLSAAEERELACRIQDGDSEARDQLIRANLRLVVKIARSYLGCGGVSIDDLIEEGNLGLMRAAELYDPGLNTRFSTYAAYWIKQSMARFLRSARPLPIPSYLAQLLTEWRRESIRLQAVLDRTPTDEEINARLKFRPRQVANIKKAERALTPGWHSGRRETDQPLEDILTTQGRGPETQIATQELVDKTLSLLDEMDGREATVLRMRYGLQGAEPMTLVQIGKEMGLTRERIRQIEKDALHKLNDKLQSPSPHELPRCSPPRSATSTWLGSRERLT